MKTQEMLAARAPLSLARLRHRIVRSWLIEIGMDRFLERSKMRMRSIPVVVGLLLMVVLATALAQSRRPLNYTFEAEPRAVLTDLGAGVSRHAKLLMRTTTLYLLAVYGA